MYVTHAGLDVDNPENTWIGKPLMFLLGKKNDIISKLHLIKLGPNTSGCSYMANISNETISKSLYGLLNLGYDLGGIARVVLCKDPTTNNDSHIFQKLYNQNLLLLSLTTGGFSIKVPDSQVGNLVKVGYKII